jgi:hypothetical protein
MCRERIREGKKETSEYKIEEEKETKKNTKRRNMPFESPLSFCIGL